MVDTSAVHAPAVPASTRPAQRWLARLAFLLAAAAGVLVLAVAGVRGSVGLLLVGVAGMAVALAGAWWFLSHRGWWRWLAGVLVIVAPLTVAILYARARLIWVVILFAVLWLAALAAGRRALAEPGGSAGPREYATPPPTRPFLIMNPRSGGGKVERFDLVARARALGAEVALLEGQVDVLDLARRAVRGGADLLGVAGGDGTQALVAGVAARHGLPFMVISAGTRNHFALDLGLDREDPATCLDALSDGVEVRVDLGLIGDRTFVNNASFGAYAAVVQSPAYRDDKTRTTLDLLPDLLVGHQGPRLRLRAADLDLAGPQAVLVSNNPYGSDDLAGLGRRPRLDGGVLGVLAVTVHGAVAAAGLVGGRRWSKAVATRATTEVVVEADVPAVPVGIDGEAIMMQTPVRCTIRPGALRVRVPRQRPGVPPPPPELDWTRLRRLALATG
jgi:diacylglycerol kinase family enzyme